MNNRDQFNNRWRMQNLSQAELDRKWRMQVEAEQEYAAMMEAAAIAAAQAQATSTGFGGGVYAVNGSCITFIMDATNNDYTGNIRIEVSSDTAYTVNWGDGVEESGEISGGTSIDHTYGDGGVYTVQLCFDNPAAVTELEFYD